MTGTHAVVSIALLILNHFLPCPCICLRAVQFMQALRLVWMCECACSACAPPGIAGPVAMRARAIGTPTALQTGWRQWGFVERWAGTKQLIISTEIPHHPPTASQRPACCWRLRCSQERKGSSTAAFAPSLAAPQLRGAWLQQRCDLDDSGRGSFMRQAPGNGLRCCGANHRMHGIMLLMVWTHVQYMIYH